MAELKRISKLLQAKSPFLHRLARFYWSKHQQLQDGKRRCRLIWKWLGSSSQNLLPYGDSGKRLLLVYDLASQPFSLGDYFVALQGALIKAEEAGCPAIDIALIYDRSFPTLTIPATYGCKGSLDLAFLFPISFLNQLTGSIFIFDSHGQYTDFVAANTEQYFIWPDSGLIMGSGCLTLHVFNEVALPFYQEHRILPRMQCRDYLRNRANDLLDKVAGDAVPVTVNLRNNKHFGDDRNSNYPAWSEFFSYCSTRYPVKFIIIGTREEADPSLRELPNVIIAKDHCTDTALDLALVQHARLHMGASSGPFIMATFSDRPYLMFNWDKPENYLGVTKEDNYYRFAYGTPLQRMFVKGEEKESAEMLILEFEKLWRHVGPQA